MQTMAQQLALARIGFDELDNVIEFDQEFWRHDVQEISVDVDNQLGTASNTERNQVRSS